MGETFPWLSLGSPHLGSGIVYVLIYVYVQIVGLFFFLFSVLWTYIGIKSTQIFQRRISLRCNESNKRNEWIILYSTSFTQLSANQCYKSST